MTTPASTPVKQLTSQEKSVNLNRMNFFIVEKKNILVALNSNVNYLLNLVFMDHYLNFWFRTSLTVVFP